MTYVGRRTILALLVSVAMASPCIAERVADDMAVIQARALELVNQSRAEHGLPALSLEDRLNAAAQSHADDMHMRHYYDHTSPEGGTVVDRYVSAGGSKWRVISENIASCTGCRPPARVGVLRRLHAGWLNSPSHRENILREGITHFGFGMVVDEERRLHAVQTFAGPGKPRGLQADEKASPLAIEEQGRLLLDRLNLARTQVGHAPLELSAALAQAAQRILPDSSLEEFDLAGREDLFEAVPEAERDRWRSISVFSANCGGCGTVPTEADVRYFAQQWLEDPSYRNTLLNARVTHVGFIIATNGDGMKVALAVLGRGRDRRPQ
jgi:uncharacterized protein YkwD